MQHSINESNNQVNNNFKFLANGSDPTTYTLSNTIYSRKKEYLKSRFAKIPKREHELLSVILLANKSNMDTLKISQPELGFKIQRSKSTIIRIIKELVARGELEIIDNYIHKGNECKRTFNTYVMKGFQHWLSSISVKMTQDHSMDSPYIDLTNILDHSDERCSLNKSTLEEAYQEYIGEEKPKKVKIIKEKVKIISRPKQNSWVFIGPELTHRTNFAIEEDLKECFGNGELYTQASEALRALKANDFDKREVIRRLNKAIWHRSKLKDPILSIGAYSTSILKSIRAEKGDPSNMLFKNEYRHRDENALETTQALYSLISQEVKVNPQLNDLFNIQIFDTSLGVIILDRVDKVAQDLIDGNITHESLMLGNNNVKLKLS